MKRVERLKWWRKSQEDGKNNNNNNNNNISRGQRIQNRKEIVRMWPEVEQETSRKPEKTKKKKKIGERFV